MARVGENPLKGTHFVKNLPPAVATVITHLPNEDGYHATRFEVVRYSLESLRRGAPGIPVAIWDNGSCERLTDWLKHEYRPEYLFLSPNVGKVNARTALWRMFPPQTILSAADDDMGYLPGWFAAEAELLTHFPNAGAVTGYVARTAFRWGNISTLKWAREQAHLEVGRFIPEGYERQFCTSIGRDYDKHAADTAKDRDYRVSYKGLSAYCTAAHCQFIGFQDRLAPLMKWSNVAMSEERSFDETIDRAGLLRLGTIERFTFHLGNVLDKEYAAPVTA